MTLEAFDEDIDLFIDDTFFIGRITENYVLGMKEYQDVPAVEVHRGSNRPRAAHRLEPFAVGCERLVYRDDRSA